MSKYQALKRFRYRRQGKWVWVEVGAKLADLPSGSVSWLKRRGVVEELPEPPKKSKKDESNSSDEEVSE